MGAKKETGDWMDPLEAQDHSLSMQEQLEDSDQVPWRGDYDALLSEGWDWYDGPDWNRWRLAAYVAWASCPADRRQPATYDEFARLVGWGGAQQLRKYRNLFPQLDQMVRENLLEPLFARRARVLETLCALAEEPDYKTFKDRELFLKLTRLYQPSQDVNLTARAITADQVAQAEAQARAELDEWAPEFGGEEEDREAFQEYDAEAQDCAEPDEDSDADLE